MHDTSSLRSDVVLRNVRVVDPQSEHHLQQVDLHISKGVIQEIGRPHALVVEGAEVVEQEGAHASPGWLDMHVHLSDPGYEMKERLEELVQAAVRGGFTGILCYPNTLPVLDQGSLLRAMMGRAQAAAIDLHLTGAVSVGAAGKELAEVYDMHQNGALAFTDGTHPVQDTGLILKALQYLQVFDGLLIHYPSEQSLQPHGQMNEGDAATSLGMPGISVLAESMAMHKALELLGYAGGRMHLQPLTAPESLLQVVHAKQRVQHLTVGTNLAYLCMQDDLLASYHTSYKLMPPLRDALQRQALLKGVQEGVIDTLSTGHQAQTVEEKNVEFALAEPGMLGLQTAFPLANMHLLESGVMQLEDWVRLISINPRKVLRLPPVSLQVGEPANLTLFQPDLEWELQAQHLFSRSRNTPLLNQRLRGKVLGIYHKELLHLATD